MSSLVGFYLDVIKTFNDNHVEYMLVGGHAVNYHGFIRATIDLDIWINPTDENFEFLLNSFIHLGYKKEKSMLAIENLKENHMIKIPRDDNIIDIFDSFIMKYDFIKAFKNHQTLNIDDVEIKIIGIDDLIEVKYKSNRYKDLLDVKELRKIKNLDPKNFRKG